MQLSELISTFREGVKKKYDIKRFSIEALARIINVDAERLRKWEKGTMPQAEADRENLKAFFDIESLESIPNKKLERAVSNFILEEPESEQYKTKTGNELRNQKAFGNAPTDDEGLVFVPVAAQAGYSRKYMDPVYIDNLERVFIPGLRYRGDNFRYFEVEGDSMYPTLEEGMHVMAQKIEPEDWKSVNNYYIHIIVTLTRVLIKRLYRKDGGSLVLISDNEDLYPQEKIKLEDIKELWLVKRKLDWRMTPPKEFKIKV